MNEAKDKIQQEALTAIRKSNYNSLIILPTGTGKGKIMVDTLLELKPKTCLYLCNTELLRDVMFKYELRKWNASHLIDTIDFMCYQSACKLKGVKYDLVLADEFDAALTPKYIGAITNNIYKHKLLVSATLDDAKKRKALKIAPLVYEQKIREVIEAKALNKQKFFFVNYQLSEAENKRYLEFNSQFAVLLNLPKSKANELKLNNLKIYRKQWLAKLNSSLKVAQWLLKKLDKPENKILVFTGLSEQADKICPPYSFHSNNGEIGLMYFNQFNAGKINKAAVVAKVDRGLNINGVNNIIHESVDSSKTRMTQRTGRGMRLDVDDVLNVFFQVPYYKDKAGKIKPTIVQQWIIKGTVDFDMTQVTTINFN